MSDDNYSVIEVAPSAISSLMVEEISKFLEEEGGLHYPMFEMYFIHQWKPSEIEKVTDYSNGTIRVMTTTMKKKLVSKFGGGLYE